MIGISGVGFIGSMGNTLDEFYKSFKQEQQCTTKIERFEVSNIRIKNAALIKEFDPKPYIERKKLKRYDIYSCLGIVSSKLAMDSYGVNWSEESISDMGLVFSNETQADKVADYLKDLFTYGPETVSPRKFSMTAANTTGCHIAIELGMKGPSINVGAKFTGGFTSIYTSYQMIKAQRVKDVLVGSADYLSQTMLEIYDKMSVFKTQTGESYGAFHPGEGAISFILSEDRFNIGKILGVTNLSSNVNPNKWPNSVERQVEALEAAKTSHNVDFYFSSQNGDSRLDDLEDKVIEKIFQTDRPKIIDLKKQIGEFSGAPMFQVLLALLMPKGSKSLISVIGPGGVHGGMLIESVGLKGEENA